MLFEGVVGELEALLGPVGPQVSSRYSGGPEKLCLFQNILDVLLEREREKERERERERERENIYA